MSNLTLQQAVAQADLLVDRPTLDAAIGLRREGETRERKLSEFFLGYKQLDLQAGEVAAWVSVPLRRDGVRLHFEKVARRRRQDKGPPSRGRAAPDAGSLRISDTST